MAFESVRGYVQLASGLGELTRARAMEAAQGILALPGVGETTGKVASQVSSLADELLATATSNRESLLSLVRAEVESAIGRLGLVPAAELEEAQAQITRLRAEVAQLHAERGAGEGGGTARKAAAGASTAPRAAARTAAAKKATTKKATTKKATTKKATAKKSTAAKSMATKATSARKTAGQQSAARTGTAKTASTRKSAARKSTAKKTAATRPNATAASTTSTAAAAESPRSAVTTRAPESTS